MYRVRRFFVGLGFKVFGVENLGQRIWDRGLMILGSRED